jgi:hypothetical protein
MHASTSAAGRNAIDTAVEIRSTAEAVALLPTYRKTKTPGLDGAAGRVAF